MRSRYTAFVVKNITYLLKSWHPSTRPDTIDSGAIPEWYDLHIIRTEKGEEDDLEGVVEFQASAFIQKKTWRLHETSRFVKEDGQWLYVDGDVKKDATGDEEKVSKTGRNAPCPCGSGKKFKRCCGR